MRERVSFWSDPRLWVLQDVEAPRTTRASTRGSTSARRSAFPARLNAKA